MSIEGETLIKENSDMIPTSMLERAKALSASLLSDAMNSQGAMNFGIKPVKPGMKVVGTAITVKVKPGDNLLLHKAIYLSGKGCVIVLDSNCYMECAVWGSMMTRAAAAMGVEGVVLDGAVRDMDELRELGLPIFAAGAVPNGPTTNGPGQINCMIDCGGVPVAPGDLVLGDEDGVTVVPRSVLEDVLEKAEEKVRKEAVRISEIMQGKLEPDWVKEKVAGLMGRE